MLDIKQPILSNEYKLFPYFYLINQSIIFETDLTIGKTFL